MASQWSLEMVFSRRRVAGPQWLGVAKVGGAASAMCVSFPSEGLPKLNWMWFQGVDGLPDLIEGLHKARGRRLPPSSLVLDRGQYTLVSAQAPDVPREEWPDALRWQLRDQIEHAIDDAVIDVLALPEGSQTRATRASIVLVKPLTQAQQIYLESDDEGHDWQVVEVPETALRNICALSEEEGKAQALMVFGEQYGMLVITFKGELLMTRTIEVVASAIAGGLEARGAAVGRAGLEVLRTLDTFERMHSQVNLSGLSVALPAGAEGMVEVLGDLVYVPITQLKLSDHLDLSALGDQAEALSNTPTFEQLCALGAALRLQGIDKGVQQISLKLPVQAKNSTPWSLDMGVKLAGATTAVAVTLGMGFHAWAGRMAVQAQEAEQALAVVQGKAPQGLPKPPMLAELEGLRTLEKNNRALHDAITRFNETASGHYSEFLEALSRQAGGNLWITALVVHPNGQDIELRGRMTNPASLPAYLERLESEPRFNGRRFARLEIKALDPESLQGASGVSEFSLTGKVHSAAKTAKEGAAQ
jgi:MSHA biogenesis protein MshI